MNENADGLMISSGLWYILGEISMHHTRGGALPNVDFLIEHCYRSNPWQYYMYNKLVRSDHEINELSKAWWSSKIKLQKYWICDILKIYIHASEICTYMVILTYPEGEKSMVTKWIEKYSGYSLTQQGGKSFNHFWHCLSSCSWKGWSMPSSFASVKC